jgi:2-keto-4-pentenoate hydratase/2-oxohepta-3-ene-1,7-dioic acid hydratase in catechol pathway
VLRPTKIIGVGLNYRAHAEEMKKPLPEEPLLFLKPPSALIGSDDPIVRPRGSWREIHYEGELAVVIGRRGHRVTRDRALDHVAGYTCMNDVTVRELQRKDVQYTRAKGFDSFAPAGPKVVAGLDPSRLRIETRLNGVVKQRSTTADMIFDVPTIIAFVSRVMTLEEGDIITTGTPPGVGPLFAGDIVEVEIEGIGVLRNPVIEEPEGAS